MSEAFLEPSDRVIDVYVDIILPVLQADLDEFGAAGFRRWRYSSRTGNIHYPFQPYQVQEVGATEGGNIGIAQHWQVPSVATTVAAFRHATGETVWEDGERAAARRLKSLERGPGIVLVQPMPMRPLFQADELLPRPAFRGAYQINDPIRLYSGQALLGTGVVGVVRWRGLMGQFISRQGPYLRASLFEVPSLSQPPAVFVIEEAQQVTIKNVDIQISRSGDRDLPTIEAGIDVRNSSEVHLANIQFDRAFNYPIRLAGGRGNWIEGCRIPRGRALTVPDDAEDTTIWSGFASCVMRLGGINSQAWFSIIEPQPPPDDIPHEVVLAGTGACVFAPRIEGIAPENRAVADTRGLVRVERGSDFAQLSAGHLTPGGFDVVVERDCASTLIRQAPMRAHDAPQALFEVGLTNLLRDSGFHRCNDEQASWDVAGVELNVDDEVRRAYDTSLRVRPLRAGGAFWQDVDPHGARGLETVADTTFAAACWVRAMQPGTVLVRIEEVQGDPEAPDMGDAPIRSASSNTHPGDGAFHYSSVLLHTSPTARRVRFKLQFLSEPVVGAADVWVSEPMLVRGAYVPPHHGRPLSESGGRVSAPLRFAQPAFELRLGAVVRPEQKLAVAGQQTAISLWSLSAGYTVVASRVLARAGRLRDVIFGQDGPASGLSATVAIEIGDGETLHFAEAGARGGPLARPIDLPAGARCNLAIRRPDRNITAPVAVGATLLLEREA